MFVSVCWLNWGYDDDERARMIGDEDEDDEGWGMRIRWWQ